MRAIVTDRVAWSSCPSVCHVSSETCKKRLHCTYISVYFAPFRRYCHLFTKINRSRVSLISSLLSLLWPTFALNTLALYTAYSFSSVLTKCAILCSLLRSFVSFIILQVYALFFFLLRCICMSRVVHLIFRLASDIWRPSRDIALCNEEWHPMLCDI